jgi:nucleoside-diphosphate-sugar epimerase
MTKKIIAITGSKGVLGCYFVKKFKNYTYDFFKGDINDYKKVQNWIENTKANYLLHLAAKVSTDSVKKDYQAAVETNFLATKNMINCISKSKKSIWFFFASTSHVYQSKNKRIKESSLTKPITLYGKTKLKAEKYLIKFCKKENIKLCIGRIFSFTHKNQASNFLIPSLYKKVTSRNTIINVKNLNHQRDFSHIDDICRAINLLRKKNCVGIYNIGSGISINLMDIIKILNNKKKIIFSKNKYKTSIVADISKINKIGYHPYFDINKILSDFRKK